MASGKRLRGSLPWIIGLLTSVGMDEAAAAIFSVGNDTDCTHGTVQGAIDALPAGGAHEIRIMAGTYTAQAVKINGRTLALRGGYASCSAATATGDSTLSGEGGTRDSVITVTGSGNDIKLERLSIVRGDETPDLHGGGIDFSGAGKLSTRNTVIAHNYAGYGGGISFNGSSGPSELTIGQDTSIMLNTAQYSGGGIRIEGEAVLRMTADRTWVGSNDALGINPTNNAAQGGYGGGIMIFNSAHAYVASPGLAAAAVVSNNNARYGGGIAVIGFDSDLIGTSTLHLYSIDPQRPVRIEGNVASNTGGGVYLETDPNGMGSWGTSSPGILCAWDFGINHNVAQNGSAIYAQSGRLNFPLFQDFGSPVQLNSAGHFCGSRPAGAVSCTAGGACNSISRNRAETVNGTPTDGATVLLQDNSFLKSARIAFRGNEGGNVVRAFPSDDRADLINALFADNQTTGSLVRNSGSGTLQIENSTFAGNRIGSQVFLSSAAFVLHRSVVWQPGVPVLSQSGGSRDVGDLLVHDASTLGGVTPTVRVADPMFLDPERGDYRPHAASLAVDFSSSGGGVDLAGNPRGFDIPLVPDTYGSGDLGAYERVDVDPLVRNGDFDGDLRFWNGGGSVGYDGSQNAAGPTGSGALRITGPVSAAGGRLVATQCVRLPGPATYLLDAWGRTAGLVTVGTDHALLGWRLIPSDPTGTCAGTATRTGEQFAGAGNTWRRMEPVEIAVGEQEWTGMTSLAVHLIALDRGVGTVDPTATAYFDGVRLRALAPAGGDDRIFADGFERVENRP